MSGKNSKFKRTSDNHRNVIYAGLLIVGFLIAGFMLGPASSQVYEGSSDPGSDTVTLDNTGNLKSTVQKIEISPAERPVDKDWVDMTGSGGYIRRVDDLSVSGEQFSFSVVYTIDDPSSWDMIFDSGGDIQDSGVTLAHFDTKSASFKVGNGSTTRGVEYTQDSEDDNIYHVIGRFDSGHLDLFVDGDLVHSFDTDINTIGLASDGFAIGGRTDYSGNMQDGNVRDLALFDSYISDSEVQTIIDNNGHVPDSISEDALAYWKMSEGMDNSLSDFSGNGYSVTFDSDYWNWDTYTEQDTASEVRPGLEIGDQRLQYENKLLKDQTLTITDDSAVVGSSDVSGDIDGNLPAITPGYSQTLKIDHNLRYVIKYSPLSMDLDIGNTTPGESLTVGTKLIEAETGSVYSEQPNEMRIRLLDGSDDVLLDKRIGKTEFVIPGEKLEQGHRQLRMSYHGTEFNGWSNEVIVDFDVGSNSYTVTTQTGDPPSEIDDVVSKVQGAIYIALDNWSDSDFPILSDFASWLIDTLGLSRGGFSV